MSPPYHDHHICCSCSHRGRTPTPRTHLMNRSNPAPDSTPHAASSTITTTKPSIGVVFIVTDTCYPKMTDFVAGNGVTRIDSVYTSQKVANSRAKKIIYENDGGCTVDIDKIIEEEGKGLYTGIGVGGQEETKGCCYARKCEVEEKFLDEDSEDEWTGKSGEEEDEEDGHEDEEVAAAAENKGEKKSSDMSDSKANGNIGCGRVFITQLVADLMREEQRR